MHARVLRALDYRRMRWKNCGGWTTELAAFPPPGGDAPARRALAISEKTTGPESTETINSLDQLGLVLRKQHKLDESRQVLDWSTRLRAAY